MKNFIKYIGISVFTLGLISSCDDASVGDDEELNYNNQINVVQFPSATATASAVADGDVKTYLAKIQVAGPDIENLNADVTANFAVDPSSTAVEGTNFTLSQNSITLKKSENYLANLPISIITDGITPPTTETIVLNITSVNANGQNVVASGNKNKVIITLSYSCFADLSGTYLVTNDWCAPSEIETIIGNADGSWNLSSADGRWLSRCTGNTTLPNPGNIFVVCGVVLPSTDLEYGTDGGFGIGDILDGSWDPVTGVLTMDHIETFFNGGPREWTSTYIRQ